MLSVRFYEKDWKEGVTVNNILGRQYFDSARGMDDRITRSADRQSRASSTKVSCQGWSGHVRQVMLDGYSGEEGREAEATGERSKIFLRLI